jgi:hypothetical protein
LVLVFLGIAAGIFDDVVLLVTVEGDGDVRAAALGGMGRHFDLGVLLAAPDHHAFDGFAELIDGAIVAGGEFAGGAIDVGFTPQGGGVIVEDVEVVGVVAFVLDDLQFDVVVVESFGTGTLWLVRPLGLLFILESLDISELSRRVPMKQQRRRRQLRPRPCRAQVHQQIERVRSAVQLFQVEALLEAARPQPCGQRLAYLNRMAGLMRDEIESLENI